MNRMTELLPVDELAAKVRADVTVLEKSDLDKITAIEPARLYNIAISVWNRIVQRRLKRVNPKAIAEWVDRADAATHEKISRIIGEPVIQDIIFMRATVWRPEDPKFIVLDFLAAEVFPNDLHLADLLVRDPTKPLRRQRQGEHDHTHRGFGLLATVFQRAEAYASRYGKDHITMTAATAGLVPIFERHGYRLEDNDVARQFLRLGQTIPMEKAVQR